MKKTLLTISIIIILVILASLLSADRGNKQDAREIMEKYSELPSIQKMKGEQKLEIYGADGSLLFTKKSRTATYIENFGEEGNEIRKTIVYFFYPPEEKGNSTLNINYENESKEDIMIIYLVGLRKPKRITSSIDKKSSYMGSDFSNNDIAYDFNIDDYNYNLLEEEPVEFKGYSLDCYKIEAIPKNETVINNTGYGKTIYYLEKKSLLNLKTEFYDDNIDKMKELTLKAFSTIKNINGDKVRFPIGIEMKNVQKGTKTEITFEELSVEEDADFNTNIFTEQYLTKKWW